MQHTALSHIFLHNFIRSPSLTLTLPTLLLSLSCIFLTLVTAPPLLSRLFVQRLLNGHANIVKLFAADIRPNGRFTEHLMLLELCPGGHVVSIMNRRLHRRFTENEVLKVSQE